MLAGDGHILDGKVACRPLFVQRRSEKGEAEGK
jgi:hypothetical protein